MWDAVVTGTGFIATIPFGTFYSLPPSQLPFPPGRKSLPSFPGPIVDQLTFTSLIDAEAALLP